MSKPIFSQWRRLDGPEWHVIIAVILLSVVWAVGWPVPAFVITNTVFWFLYESFTGYWHGKTWFPWKWGVRKNAEMLAPMAAGGVIYLIWMGTQ